MDTMLGWWSGFDAESRTEEAYFEKYETTASCHRIQEDLEEQIFSTAIIRIKPGLKAFTHYLSVQNTGMRTRRRKKVCIPDDLSFLISTRMRLCSEVIEKRVEHTMIFEWKAEDKEVYQLRFKSGKKKDLTSAHNFKEIMCKLIYKHKFRSEIPDSQLPSEYLIFCRPKQCNELLPCKSENESLIASTDEYMSASLSESKISYHSSAKGEHGSENMCSTSTADFDLTPDLPLIEIEVRKKICKETGKLIEIKKEETDANMDILDSIHTQIPVEQDIFKREGDLYEYISKSDFILAEKSAVLVLTSSEESKHQLRIYNNKEELVYSKPIYHENNYHIDFHEEVFKWVDQRDGSLKIRLFKFNESDLKVLHELESALYMLKVSYDIKSECTAQKYTAKKTITKSFALDNTESVARNLEFDFTLLTSEEYLENAPAKSEKDTGEVMVINAYIAQARTVDRVFSVKDDRIEVHKRISTDKDQLELICRLPRLKAIYRDSIRPKKIMFYEDDKKMLLLNRKLDKKIYCFDLAKGFVTNELFVDGFNRICDLKNLYPLTTDESLKDVFIGFNQKALFTFVPSCTEDFKGIPCKNYSSNLKLSCIAPAHSGRFATGSLDGKIRLFRELGKKATNILHGFGDPIFELDSTQDGKWLLATTKEYLMLYPTTVGDKDAYINPIRRNKPVPIKLDIAIDVYASELDLLSACFDDQHHLENRRILTASSSTLFIWEFNTTTGISTGPTTFEVGSEIIECQFVAGRTDQVYAVTHDNVVIVDL